MRQTPDILYVCVCVCVVFLVGEQEGVQIRVCIEEPGGCFINLHGESFLSVPDKTLSALALKQAARLPPTFVL